LGSKFQSIAFDNPILTAFPQIHMKKKGILIETEIFHDYTHHFEKHRKFEILTFSRKILFHQKHHDIFKINQCREQNFCNHFQNYLGIEFWSNISKNNKYTIHQTDRTLYRNRCCAIMS